MCYLETNDFLIFFFRPPRSCDESPNKISTSNLEQDITCDRDTSSNIYNGLNVVDCDTSEECSTTDIHKEQLDIITNEINELSFSKVKEEFNIIDKLQELSNEKLTSDISFQVNRKNEDFIDNEVIDNKCETSDYDLESSSELEIEDCNFDDQINIDTSIKNINNISCPNEEISSSKPEPKENITFENKHNTCLKNNLPMKYLSVENVELQTHSHTEVIANNNEEEIDNNIEILDTPTSENIDIDFSNKNTNDIEEHSSNNLEIIDLTTNSISENNCSISSKTEDDKSNEIENNEVCGDT